MKNGKIKIGVGFAREKLFDADFITFRCPWDYFLQEAKKAISGADFKKLEEMVKKHGNRKSTRATQFPMDGGGSVIWLHPEAKLGTLVHEIVHASHHLLKCREVPLSEDTEEVYAYLQQFLVETLTK